MSWPGHPRRRELKGDGQLTRSASKVEQHTWRKTLLAAIDKTERATISILTGDWLEIDPPTTLPADTSRRAELARIRQIFVPDLILRLHAVLTTHHAFSPNLLQRALDLTKIVADEENRVYAEFFGRGSNPYRLVAYLDKVREAALLSLKTGGTAFQVRSVG